MILVPGGTPHGTRNDSVGIVRVCAVFPATTVDISYLERNPAPGTEGAPPRPTFTVDLRSGW
jgi:hypothetical protein